MKNLFILLSLFLFITCSQAVDNSRPKVELSNKNLISGERVFFKSLDKKVKDLECNLINRSNNTIIENYTLLKNNDDFIINRFLNVELDHYEKYKFSCIINDNHIQEININIEPSIIIKSFCHTESCDSISGNVLNLVKNKISINIFKLASYKVKYSIITPYNSYEIDHEFNSPVNNDYLDNVVLDKIPEDISFYLAILKIHAYDNEGNSAETELPFKVVRPLEVKHFGKYELAEVYDPIPVTGCIPGSIGNNVQYSESTSETRQNNLSVTYNKNWSDSFTSSSSVTSSEGVSVGQTDSTVLSSSINNSETQSESYSDTTSQGESNNITFNSSDGENWSWSLDESETNTDGMSQTDSSNTGVTGSTTVGVSGEGSLPFLAKASGKVEVSAGVSRNWGNTNTESSSESNSSSRGYSTGGLSQNGKSFGSVQNDSSSHSLSGSYVLSSSVSSLISESSSLSSSRVWNMSESLISGKVITEGNSESISKTLVSSESSSTTFSYSAYIPRGRYGIFFRQTSRYVTLSEIISYTLDGFPIHAGFIMMNSWSWAPELSIGNSCEEALISNLPQPECLITPCN